MRREVQKAVIEAEDLLLRKVSNSLKRSAKSLYCKLVLSNLRVSILMPQSFIARPIDRPKMVKGGISTSPPLLEVELMDSLLIILLSGPERIV